MSVGTTSFVFKKGDTFSAKVRLRPKKDGVQDIVGASITSTVKDYKSSNFSLDCSLQADGLTIFVVGSSSLTDDFSTGVARWDVRIELQGGTVIHTPTVQFVVVDEVTKAPVTP